MGTLVFILALAGYIFIGAVGGRVAFLRQVFQCGCADRECKDDPDHLGMSFLAGAFWPVAILCMLGFSIVDACHTDSRRAIKRNQELDAFEHTRKLAEELNRTERALGLPPARKDTK